MNGYSFRHFALIVSGSTAIGRAALTDNVQPTRFQKGGSNRVLTGARVIYTYSWAHFRLIQSVGFGVTVNLIIEKQYRDCLQKCLDAYVPFVWTLFSLLGRSLRCILRRSAGTGWLLYWFLGFLAILESLRRTFLRK